MLSNDTKIRMGREFIAAIRGWLQAVDHPDYRREAPSGFDVEIATAKRQVAEVEEWLATYAPE